MFTISLSLLGQRVMEFLTFLNLLHDHFLQKKSNKTSRLADKIHSLSNVEMLLVTAVIPSFRDFPTTDGNLSRNSALKSWFDAPGLEL